MKSKILIILKDLQVINSLKQELRGVIFIFIPNYKYFTVHLNYLHVNSVGGPTANKPKKGQKKMLHF